MSDAADSRLALARLLARFPDQSARLRRRFLRDAAFRAICHDYALAVVALERFEARSDGDQRPEVTDYRTVIAELEIEIREALQDSDPD